MPTTSSDASNQAFVVAALYKFVAIDDPAALRDELSELCRELGLLGTVLLAHEGINATLAGSAAAISRLRDWFDRRAAFAGMQWKLAKTDVQPFLRLKLRLKPEIVTMGVADIDPARTVGTYVDPAHWNELRDLMSVGAGKDRGGSPARR